MILSTRGATSPVPFRTRIAPMKTRKSAKPSAAAKAARYIKFVEWFETH